MYTIFATKHPNWTFLYTDASKSSWSMAFAVVDNMGKIFTIKGINNVSSKFTAEAAGIMNAIQFATKSKKNNYFLRQLSLKLLQTHLTSSGT